MAPELVTPAGAETPATETISAERAASDRGDVGAFLNASRERRTGKAPADVTQPKPAAQTGAARRERPATEQPGAAWRQQAAAVPGRDGQPAAGPTDKDRQADERLATRVRQAVDEATADSTRRIRELEEQLGASRRPADTKPTGDGASAEPGQRKGPLTSAEIKRYGAMAGAPKLDDKDQTGAYVYETAHEHAVALSHFISETRSEERASTARTESAHVDRVKKEAARVSSFGERIEAFKQANPDRLVDNGKGGKGIALSPEVAGLHGFGMLAQTNADRRSKGLQLIEASVDHSIAEELYDSAIPMECAVYLSDHPEELAALRMAQTPGQLARMFGALEERVRLKQPTTTKPAGSGAAATAAAVPAKPKTTADERREAQDAVDRSVSSTRPLNGNLGRPGSTEKDPTETAIEKQDVGMFLEVERSKRQEQLDQRLGRSARR